MSYPVPEVLGGREIKEETRSRVPGGSFFGSKWSRNKAPVKKLREKLFDEELDIEDFDSKPGRKLETAAEEVQFRAKVSSKYNISSRK